MHHNIFFKVLDNVTVSFLALYDSEANLITVAAIIFAFSSTLSMSDKMKFCEMNTVCLCTLANNNSLQC